MKKTNFFSAVLFLMLVVALGGCPSDSQTALEEARFLLDKCNPSDPSTVSFCNDAFTKANTVFVDSGSTDVAAAALVSSADLGIAGVDFLEFAEKLGAQTTTASDFSTFTKAVTDVENERKAIDPTNFAIDTAKLRAAAAVLETASLGTLAGSNLFQRSAIQAMELFIVPAKALNTASGNTVSNTSITTTEFNNLNKSLDGSDSGLTDDKTLKAARAGRCLCLQTAFGYTCTTGPKCLRDLVRCSNDSGDNKNTQDTEQDYDGDGVVTGDRANDCDKLLNPTNTAAVDACKATNFTTSTDCS
ncbi:MAG: hypothetical protein HY073_00010 [Deltaproteobacteria bacterium]|nr:hypothetical protein [Deltaproteobacteria bacterium]